MYILLLTVLLSEPSNADKARVLLLLAAAKARQAPATPLLFERLPMPTEETYQPPRARTVPRTASLSLEQAAALAARTRRPLVLWVGGYDDAVLRGQLSDCIHCQVDTWRQSAARGVVPCPLIDGWPHGRRLIPAAEVDAVSVRKELAALVRDLSSTVPPSPRRVALPAPRFLQRSGNC